MQSIIVRRMAMRRKSYQCRISALLMSVVIGVGMLPADYVYAAQEKTTQGDVKEMQDTAANEPAEIIYETVEIYTAEDLLDFADNCYIDKWSANKSVVLKADIDLRDIDDFASIPVFSGIFDGSGHTISGLHHTGAGYVTGLFRYIESSGIVKNLTLKGSVEGDDEEECIGGLCGVNYGTIKNCNFHGTVKGRDTIGGIVGINESSGTVTDCTVTGRILGNYSTGGVVGINHGVINRCTNYAGVNDNTEWVEDDDEIGTGIFLSISLNEDETELYSGVDAGGIAGYSDGMLSRCKNEGIVGYEHSGYNIGGIAGRQSGMVSLCTNNGEVYGRKDVGGIVGQMEPFIEIDEAESLRTAINKLHDVIEKTLDDIESTKNVLKTDIDDLENYAKDAVDTGDELVTQLTDFVDDNIEQVNAFGDRMDYVLDMMPGVMDNVDAALNGFSSLNGIIDDLSDDLDFLSDTYKPTQYQRISLVTTVGGKLSCDRQEPAEGDTVTVTVSPDTDYRLKAKTFAVKDKNGKKVSFTDAGNNKYTFVMPKNNVLVTAEFEHTGTFKTSGVEGVNTISGNVNEEALTEQEAVSENEQEQPQETEEDNQVKDTQEPETKEPETKETETAEEKTTEEKTTEEDNAESKTEEKTAEEDNAEGKTEETQTQQKESESEPSSGNAGDEAYSETESSTQLSSESESSQTQESSEASDNKVSTAFIILSSNLGGTASYKCDADGAVALTITPYEGYGVSGNPTVKDSKGKKVSVSKKKAGDTAYSFNISKSVQPCTVKISFKKLNKGQAADAALNDIISASDELSEDVDSIKASIEKIKSIIVNPDGSIKLWSSLTDAQKKEVQAELLNISDKLSDALSSGSSALSALSSLQNVLATLDITGTVNDVKKDIDKATDCLQNVINSFKAASNSVRDIVNYLNTQPDIKFVKLGDEFDATKETLHDKLKGISDSLESLSDNASAYSDVINDDLRAVNDQLNVVFNLLADTMTDLSELDLEQYYEDDIDDETLAQLTTGRTDICTNKGVVRGDINVGGIAGSMSIDSEDLEGNAAGSVDFELGSKFITRCAITGGVNEGYVTAKKNGAGGIVGYMNHGVVVDSEGYGSVESTEGNYAGGIAGESHTIIKRCYALNSVSGVKNVGGIAGYAETLKNCYAMSTVKAESGRAGAIAGQINGYENIEGDEEEIKVADNYYVGDDIYGIDNISYTGIAEPVTYDELLAAENLPTQFWHLKVIYKIEDEYLGFEELEYGARLDSLNYPEIPEKEGCYGIWEDVTDKIMKGTMVVEAEYRDNVTVVESGEKQEKKPYALVNDIFTENTVLNAVISNMTPPEAAAHSRHVIYEVSLENSGLNENSSFAVRLLNPYDNAEVWAYRNGEWIKLEGKVRGQYLQVDMNGTDEIFCLADVGQMKPVLIACITAGAVLLVIILMLCKRKAKVRKNKGNKEKNRKKTNNKKI